MGFTHSNTFLLIDRFVTERGKKETRRPIFLATGEPLNKINCLLKWKVRYRQWWRRKGKGVLSKYTIFFLKFLFSIDAAKSQGISFFTRFFLLEFCEVVYNCTYTFESAKTFCKKNKKHAIYGVAWFIGACLFAKKILNMSQRMNKWQFTDPVFVVR